MKQLLKQSSTNSAIVDWRIQTQISLIHFYFLNVFKVALKSVHWYGNLRFEVLWATLWKPCAVFLDELDQIRWIISSASIAWEHWLGLPLRRPDLVFFSIWIERIIVLTVWFLVTVSNAAACWIRLLKPYHTRCCCVLYWENTILVELMVCWPNMSWLTTCQSFVVNASHNENELNAHMMAAILINVVTENIIDIFWCMSGSIKAKTVRQT